MKYLSPEFFSFKISAQDRVDVQGAPSYITHGNNGFARRFQVKKLLYLRFGNVQSIFPVPIEPAPYRFFS